MLNMAEVHARNRPNAELADFLEDIALNANDEKDSDDGSDDRVTVMTLHSAKGLEFDEVYLVGMEEGLLPHLRSIQDGDVDEERRLAYVGITRARRRLTITHANTRARYGKRVTALASRFLYEMNGKPVPEKLLELSGEAVGLALSPKNKSGEPKNKKRAKRRKKRVA
jgi:superfamily I DNA/RNA helicase